MIILLAAPETQWMRLQHGMIDVSLPDRRDPEQQEVFFHRVIARECNEDIGTTGGDLGSRANFFEMSHVQVSKWSPKRRGGVVSLSLLDFCCKNCSIVRVA